MKDDSNDKKQRGRPKHTLKGESKMHPLKDEKSHMHRAFLLWAMQSKAKRNQRAVSRALNCSHTSINTWMNRFKWKERAGTISSETEAQQLYRHMYMKQHGTSEIQCVEHNIVSPVSAGTVPRGVASSVQSAMNKTSQKLTNIHEKEVKRKQLMLLDASIAYVAQGMKDGSLKRNMRDLPLLIQLRNQLMEHETNQNTAAGIVHESIRVKEAKEKGKNVIAAMYEDAKELTSILGSLSVVGQGEKEILRKGENSE